MGVTDRIREAVDQAMQASSFSAGAQPGWYPDASDANLVRYWDGARWTENTQPAVAASVPPADPVAQSVPVAPATAAPVASAAQRMHYVVLQVTLKEKLLGTGSGNLTQLERAINDQAAKGYRLHTITTASGGSGGFGGGDRIQATMVFEKIL